MTTSNTWQERFDEFVEDKFGYPVCKESDMELVRKHEMKQWIEQELERAKKEAYEEGVMAFRKLSKACGVTDLITINDKLYIELGNMESIDPLGITLVPTSELQKLRGKYLTKQQ